MDNKEKELEIKIDYLNTKIENREKDFEREQQKNRLIIDQFKEKMHNKLSCQEYTNDLLKKSFEAQIENLRINNNMKIQVTEKQYKTEINR